MNNFCQLLQRGMYLSVLLIAGCGLLHAQGEPAAEAAPAVPTQKGILHSPTLTGDWGGARTSMVKHGFNFDVSLVQFGQGAAVGGSEQSFEYSAKSYYAMTVDATKLGAWPGLSVYIKGETRFGSDGLFSVGTLIPINTTEIVPKDQGAVSSITSLYVTQIIKNKYVVQAGKFNTLDLVANPFAGGSGIKTFMNLGITAPPVDARTVPAVTDGFVVAALKGYEPLLSLAILSSQDSSTTSGLGELFSKGVTFLPTLSVPVKLHNLSGHQNLYGTYSTLSATSLDKIGQLLLPPGLITPKTVEGAWSVNYAFDQYLRQDPKNPAAGWGVFGQLGFSDTNPSPISLYTTIGLGGNGIFAHRYQDRFGVAYFFAGISSPLKQAVTPVLNLRNEQGAEMFYNWAPAPWFKLTGDLQIVQSFRSAVSVAVVPAIRSQIVF